jgi:hypothetical protein
MDDSETKIGDRKSARWPKRDEKLFARERKGRYDFKWNSWHYCHIRGMAEKPSPLGEDFSLIFAKGFNG